MALEDRIRSSVDAALTTLRARLDQDLRTTVEHLVQVALDDQEQAINRVHLTALEKARTDTQIELQAVEASAQSRMDSAVHAAHVGEREATMAAVTRLLESVRSLDAAVSLGEVLDALGHAAGREASRAAVLVVRNERVLGWKLAGFGARDAQPKSIDLGLTESGVIGQAVAAARAMTTRDSRGNPEGPDFAHLPEDRLGFAVPVTVGGRVVAVVYADSVEEREREHAVPSGWPEVIEVLARHAGRCLEALTVQKTAAAPSPRFWVPAPHRQDASVPKSQTPAGSAPSAAPTELEAPPRVGA